MTRSTTSRRAVAGLAALLAPAAVAAASVDVELTLRSTQHADAVALSHLGDDDAVLSNLAPRSGRNLAYVDDEVRVAVRQGPWRWSLLARNHGLLVTDEDTLDLVATVRDGSRETRDRQWQAHGSYRHWQGGGLELARRFEPAPGWSVHAGAQALALSHWRLRDIDGWARFDAASRTYSVGLRSWQGDDRLDFPFQQRPASRGAAVLGHLELDWQGRSWGVAAAVRDAGWQRWSRLPQQEARIATDVADYDPDGFLIYQPLITGQNRQDGLNRWHAPTWSFSVSRHSGGAGRWTVGTTRLPRFGHLPFVGWERGVGPVEASAAWHVHERRLDLGARWNGWWLQLGADTKGRSQRFGLGGAWPF